jgi:nitrogen fixation NifU-like protein
MDIYREVLLDHYRHPHHFGLKDQATCQADGHNQLCGDAVTVQLDLQGEDITDMRFTGRGCAISIASASLLTDSAIGKKISDVRAWNITKIEELLNTPLPPARINCALLALHTAQQALTHTYAAS